MDLKESVRDPTVTGTIRVFSMAQMISYFIETIAADRKQSSDFKSLRESSFQMFKDGHIQHIQVKKGFNTLIVKSNCLPEMKKDRVYGILLRLHQETAEIQFAKCECVAGKGPKSTCKHIAAVCYCLEEFSRRFVSEEQEVVSCTDELMRWNQPRKRRLPPRLISELDFSTEAFGKNKRKTNLVGRKSEEIIGEISESDRQAQDKFKASLDKFQKTSKHKLAILAVLNRDQVSTPPNEAIPMDIDEDDSDETEMCFTERGVLFKKQNNLIKEKRMWLFENTMDQSNSELWFKERKTRITGSICGRILQRNHSIYPSSILKSFFQNSSLKTASVIMGKEQEPLILSRYVQYQRANGHATINISSAGFLVDRELGWLGASPDAIVEDGHYGKGCAEVKAAVSKWNKSLTEAASEGCFCLQCLDQGGQLQLKEKHSYYHQCQLQLYVGRDIFNFCDFVIATANDIYIQRITLNSDWVSTNIPELECFYDSFVLPRLLKQ